MSYPGPGDHRTFGYQGNGTDDSGIDRVNPALGMQSYGGDDYGGAGYQDGGYQAGGMQGNTTQGGYQDSRGTSERHAWREDKRQHKERYDTNRASDRRGYQTDAGFRDRGYESKGQSYGDSSSRPFSNYDERGYDDYQTGCSPEGCPDDPYGMPNSQSQRQQHGSQNKSDLFQRGKNIYHDMQGGQSFSSNQYKDQYP